MISAGTIGSTFTIIDEASPTLRRIAEEFENIGRIMKTIQDAMARFGEGFKNADLALKGVTEGLSLVDTKIGDAVRNADGLARAFDKAKMAAAEIKVASPAASELRIAEAAAIGGAGAAGGGGRRGPRHGIGQNHLDGFMMFMGAEAGLHGAEDVIKLGAEVKQVQMQMQQGGASAQEIATATRIAAVSAGDWGQPIKGVLEDLKEMKFVYGSLEESQKHIGDMERLRVVAHAANPEKDQKNLAYDAAKAGEFRGFTRPEQYAEFNDTMAKVLNSTGGIVGPHEYMQALKYASVSAKGFNEDFIRNSLPTLIAEQGGSKAGTGLMSLYQWGVNGVMKKTQMENLENEGLIGDSSKINSKKQATGPGFLVDTAGLIADPKAWEQKYIEPKLAQFGDLAVEANKTAATEFVGKFIGNRTASQEFVTMALQHQQMQKDAKLTSQSNGMGAAADLQQHDYATVVARFTTSWSNMLAAMGGPGVDGAIKAMNTLSSAFSSMGEFFTAHPIAAQVADATIALGTFALAIGTVVKAVQFAAGGLASLIPKGVAGGATTVAAEAGAGGAVTAGLGAGVAALALPLAVTVAGGIAAANRQKELDAAAATINTPRGQAVPDLAKQSWSDFLMGRAPGGKSQYSIFNPISPAEGAELKKPSNPYGSLGHPDFSKPMAVMPAGGGGLRVVAPEGIKVQGKVEVFGDVKAEVRGSVMATITNIGEIGGAVASAVGGAVQSAVAGMHIPNQSASSDDHGTFHSPDVSFG